MSLVPDDPMPDADALLAAATHASDRACRRLVLARHDMFVEEEDRIDDAVRTAFRDQLRRIVDGIAHELVTHARRALAGMDRLEAATTLVEAPSPYATLVRHRMLAEPDLVIELLGRVELDAIADGLPGAANEDPDMPSLLARLADHPDRLVAQAARGLVAAESRRRNGQGSGPFACCDFSAEVQHRLTWQVAAALRATAAEIDSALDIALGDAARRSLRGYDEGERIESIALRMAVALDAGAGDLGPLLLDTLSDRRLTLFVALLARALGTDFAAARDLVLDRASDRLWIALRSLGLSRTVLAQIGFQLSEADPRRDLDLFVERLDPVMAIEPAAASHALARLRSDPVYRRALARLEGAA